MHFEELPDEAHFTIDRQMVMEGPTQFYGASVKVIDLFAQLQPCY